MKYALNYSGRQYTTSFLLLYNRKPSKKLALCKSKIGKQRLVFLYFSTSALSFMFSNACRFVSAISRLERPRISVFPSAECSPRYLVWASRSMRSPHARMSFLFRPCPPQHSLKSSPEGSGRNVKKHFVFIVQIVGAFTLTNWSSAVR